MLLSKQIYGHIILKLIVESISFNESKGQKTQNLSLFEVLIMHKVHINVPNGVESKIKIFFLIVKGPS